MQGRHCAIALFQIVSIENGGRGFGMYCFRLYPLKMAVVGLRIPTRLVSRDAVAEGRASLVRVTLAIQQMITRDNVIWTTLTNNHVKKMVSGFHPVINRDSHILIEGLNF